MAPQYILGQVPWLRSVLEHVAARLWDNGRIYWPSYASDPIAHATEITLASIFNMKQIQAFVSAAASLYMTLCHALPYNTPRQEVVYPGWSGIKTMFVFGDSYTATGFNLTLDQPNKANPFGNPPYPGYTSANGPNWIDFLTTTYNDSFISTVNFAYGGATIDSDLVSPYLPTVLSVKQQVEDEYLPFYRSEDQLLAWEIESTLFAIFVGINDVGRSFSTQNTTLTRLIFTEYASLVDKLYQSGARNFLFLNVPPVDRSPQTIVQGPENQALEAASIADWNTRLVALSGNLTLTYTDVTTFVFDSNEVFGRVLDDPCAYEQTCAYKNTTAFCQAYAGGTPDWYAFDESCGVPVDEYFWYNDLHATFRVHNATAELIAGQLR